WSRVTWGAKAAGNPGDEVAHLGAAGSELGEARCAGGYDFAAALVFVLADAAVGDVVGGLRTGQGEEASGAAAASALAAGGEFVGAAAQHAGEDGPRGTVGAEAAAELAGVVVADRVRGRLRKGGEGVDDAGGNLDHELDLEGVAGARDELDALGGVVLAEG